LQTESKDRGVQRRYAFPRLRQTN